MDVFQLIDRAAAVPTSATGGQIYARFEREPDTLVIAVADEQGRPVGLIERNAFFLKMAAEHGRALYAGRSVSILMDTDFLCVDHQTSAGGFCRQVLADRPSALLRGFVAVQDGRYLGVGTVLSLLRAASADAEARAEEMSQALDRLAAAEAEARAASLAKSQFIAVMSHELRTPMNGVLAVAELLHRQPLEGDSAGYVQTIVDSSATLLRIVSDAIDLSRADTARLELAPEPTLLRALIDEVQALWLPRAQTDGVTLSVSLTGDAEAAALIDAVRLKQVFNNLIGNALKFTRRGGVEVSLHAERAGDVVRLLGRVRDTGPGVDAAELERIFEPFAQEERGAKAGGAGLGLAICRQIVTAMGGRIWAEANAGSGATFLFEVEAPPAAAAPGQAGDADEADDRSLRAHLLIVDDNPTNRMVAEAIVGLFGCTCETVTDGAEAVEAARAGRFDAILMDIKMPRMDGGQATRAIRELPGPAGAVPIVALTANADPEDARRYVAAGMASVVEKPIKADRLFSAIKSAVGLQTDEAVTAAA